MEAVEAVCEPLDAPGDAPRRVRHFWEAGNLRATGIDGDGGTVEIGADDWSRCTRIWWSESRIQMPPLPPAAHRIAFDGVMNLPAARTTVRRQVFNQSPCGG
jgi:hypothetical protein